MPLSFFWPLPCFRSQFGSTERYYVSNGTIGPPTPPQRFRGWSHQRVLVGGRQITKGGYDEWSVSARSAVSSHP
jgi:hypothetical protein